jgi:hypothetical protein
MNEGQLRKYKASGHATRRMKQPYIHPGELVGTTSNGTWLGGSQGVHVLLATIHTVGKHATFATIQHCTMCNGIQLCDVLH